MGKGLKLNQAEARAYRGRSEKETWAAQSMFKAVSPVSRIHHRDMDPERANHVRRSPIGFGLKGEKGLDFPIFQGSLSGLS